MPIFFFSRQSGVCIFLRNEEMRMEWTLENDGMVIEQVDEQALTPLPCCVSWLLLTQNEMYSRTFTYVRHSVET
jgi:hypothetical protein